MAPILRSLILTAIVLYLQNQFLNNKYIFINGSTRSRFPHRVNSCYMGGIIGGIIRRRLPFPLPGRSCFIIFCICSN